MATVEQCAQALEELAKRLEASDEARGRADFDRSLSCTVRDLDVIFAGHLHDGLLTDIRQVSQDPQAQVRLTMTSDDLVDMVAGRLNLASAWASGRVKVDARVFDLVKLRSVF